MNDKIQYSEINNNSLPAGITEIPELDYEAFYIQLSEMLRDEAMHCLAYYAVDLGGYLKFYCCVGDDENKNIRVFSHKLHKGSLQLKSLTPVISQLHIFEREIHENFGVEFNGHPWLKPVRYPNDRSDKSEIMNTYPFYGIESEELHEVGVGPIHAGVIEPGHFRFICNGEKVLHLEIHLGYQHRGIEKLFLEKNDPVQRCVLAESISGDTPMGHELAHTQLIESLGGLEVPDSLQIERCIALELERLAVHIGDTAALCGDVAYQLGQAVCEGLRTAIINATQNWCGNRFGKGLIRPGGSNYPLNETTAADISRVVSETGSRFREVCDLIYTLPSVLARFDDIGQITRQQGLAVGAVGMAARSCGISRDIRKTHPFQSYRDFQIKPVLLDSGDVLARGRLRFLEAMVSVNTINSLIGNWLTKDIRPGRPVYNYKLKPGCFAISLVEGWRGEICHTAFTDSEGNLVHYKVKDPSFHNWLALALAVRNQEISDFPVCNKSFNLSYCGNDL